MVVYLILVLAEVFWVVWGKYLCIGYVHVFWCDSGLFLSGCGVLINIGAPRNDNKHYTGTI